jgi:hypothetical protein
MPGFEAASANNGASMIQVRAHFMICSLHDPAT